MGQKQLSRHVTHGEDPLPGRPEFTVDDDFAAGPGLETDRLETQTLRQETAPGTDENGVGLEDSTRGETYAAVFLSPSLHRLHHVSRHRFDPDFPVQFVEEVVHFPVFPREEAVHCLHQGDPGPGAVKDEGQFGADGTAADDDHGGRGLRQVQGLGAGNDPFPVHVEARNGSRCRTGGQDYLLRFDSRDIAPRLLHLYGTGSGEAPPSRQDLDAGLAAALSDGSREPPDEGVLVGHQSRPAAGGIDTFFETGEEELGGYAPAVRAGSAEGVPFNEDDLPCPVARCRENGGVASRSSADDHQPSSPSPPARCREGAASGRTGRGNYTIAPPVIPAP